MFQNLRTNSTLYMLHKGASPVLECARVIEVKNLRTVYKNGPTVLYPQPVEVVDIIAQSDNNDTITLTEIPAKQSTVDDVKSNMLVSSSREEMNAEILTMKQKSEDVLKSVEYHKNFLSACQQMLSALNPEFAAKQQQEQKISQLESQIAEMAKGMSELMKFNKMLAEQLGVNPETNKKK